MGPSLFQHHTDIITAFIQGQGNVDLNRLLIELRVQREGTTKYIYAPKLSDIPGPEEAQAARRNGKKIEPRQESQEIYITPAEAEVLKEKIDVAPASYYPIIPRPLPRPPRS